MKGIGMEIVGESGPMDESASAEAFRGAPPVKKRKKPAPFTARALAECRKRGWTAGVVERRIQFPKPQGTTIDLFGVIDVIAIADGRIIGIQVTSGSNHDSRKDKILAESRALEWIERGRGHLELWSWSKRGDRGARKRWTLRVEAFTVEDWGKA
jgi:hypothetical protein